ncbi:phage protein NinX family protein [Proteus mirabilis]|uniref:phage protein NinX family protein n=1 Tax=Proteus mirabilis TaxID=584 RepID=UPI003F1CDC2F
MNKYTGLSDFEINKKVAEKLGPAYEVTRYGVVTRMSNKEQWREFNPCNNPADAMPIIIENKLTLSPRYDSDEWISESLFYHDICSVNKNPYRAAMEVFLMMKDAENEG